MPTPILLSTWSFGLRGHAVAWPPLASGGSSVDAVETVCRVVEADEEVDSVARGGLPDEEGQVTVDACIMLAPNRCGSVAAMRRCLHPTSVARQVMEAGRHVMLVGSGAERFAAVCGIPESDLLTPAAEKSWRRWQQTPAPIDQSRDRALRRPPRPIDTAGDGRLFERHEEEDRWKHHDTIGAIALDGHGVLAGACSTSGAPFKQAGRVGDSPIIGHGLYVDPEVGAAVATGSGELIMGVCGSFLAVEAMRRGGTPLGALLEVLERIQRAFDLRPEHQVALIALSSVGRWASAALRPGFRTSLTTAERNEIIEPDAVLEAGLPGV